MELVIKKYTDAEQDIWDKFVLEESMNGTFLQTRKFIEYHPKERFTDNSVIIYKGNAIVACILACIVVENEKRIFFSHKGSTFGGIIISKKFYSASNVAALMDLFDEYLKKENISSVYLKQTAPIFCRENVDLIDYFLYQRGCHQYDELNYYMQLEKYKKDILSQFSSGKRRDYRYSLKNQLEFRELTSPDEIKEFYIVLQLNLKKLNLNCVHQFDELLDLKFNRFPESIHFFGVFYCEKMVAGSMTFIFDNRIMHTQYLASDEKYLKFFPMDFLIYNLIDYATINEMEKFTFGICTENHGKYLNLGLSRFKEGFGAEFCINRTYWKDL